MSLTLSLSLKGRRDVSDSVLKRSFRPAPAAAAGSAVCAAASDGLCAGAPSVPEHRGVIFRDNLRDFLALRTVQDDHRHCAVTGALIIPDSDEEEPEEEQQKPRYIIREARR